MKTVLAWVFSTSLAFAQLGPGAGVPVGPGASSGGGGGGSTGTVTSVCTGPGATGGCITTTGTISTQELANPQTGANYPIVTGDWGNLVVLSNASPQTPTIAQAGTAGFPAGFYVEVVNTGAGTQTITPATSTINGAASYALAQNQGVKIVSDGTNYQIQPGAGGPALPVSGANGGTGVANTAKTITLGASVTTTGAGAPTLAFPATPQTYTYPSAADTLAGLLTFAAPPAIGNTTPAAGAFTTLSATGQITSTLATGTAPFVVASTTNVANLNASSLGGATFAAPGAIGGGTASTGAFTTISGTTFTGTSFTVNSVTSNTSAILLNIQNASTGAAAQNLFRMGDTVAGLVTHTLNGSGNSSGNGTASLTINNNESTLTGGMYLQTAGTNAITMSKAQAVGLPGLASSSAAQTGTVCWTTGGGNLTVDTTTTCLLSLEELKDIRGPINGALDKVMRLKPFWYSWKEGTPERAGDTHEQPGLGAHQVEGVDHRLSGYGTDGTLHGVRYQQLTAVLVAAIQEQQKQINSLKAQISKSRVSKH